MTKIVALTAGLTLLISCKKDKASAYDCSNEVSFAQQVEPLIVQNCSTSGCHDVSASGGYEFKDYSTISSAAERIVSAIKHESGIAPMPLGEEKFSDSLIGIVDCWVASGKQNN